MTLCENALFICVAGVTLFHHVTSSRQGTEPQLTNQLQELQERVKILQNQHGDWLTRQQHIMDLLQQQQDDLHKQRMDFEKQIDSLRWESDRQKKELLDMIGQQQRDIRKQRENFEKQMASTRRECDVQTSEMLDTILQQQQDLRLERSEAVGWETHQHKTELLALIQQQQQGIQKQRTEFEEEKGVFREEGDQQREESRSRLAAQDEMTQLLHQLMDRRRLPEAGDMSGRHGLYERPPLQNNSPWTETAVFRRSDDNGPVDAVLSRVTQQITEMTSEIEALKHADLQHDQARGTTYTRWGHASCPDSSELLYTGILAGSGETANGGAANHLCLTSQPVFDDHKPPSDNSPAFIYGSEYDICPEPECQLTPACAMCRVPRASSVMIPGTNTCLPGWTEEYSGYIMAGLESNPGSSEYICVDSSRGYISSTNSNDNENVIYYTVAKCGALPCPPFEDGKLVTCVVCTK